MTVARTEITRDVRQLARSGVGLVDLYSQMGARLYRNDLLTADEAMDERRKRKNGESQVVDLVNEDLVALAQGDIDNEELIQRYQKRYMDRVRPRIFIHDDDDIVDPPQPTERDLLQKLVDLLQQQQEG
jgi:hypothetical protein